MPPTRIWTTRRACLCRITRGEKATRYLFSPRPSMERARPASLSVSPVYFATAPLRPCSASSILTLQWHAPPSLTRFSPAKARLPHQLLQHSHRIGASFPRCHSPHLHADTPPSCDRATFASAAPRGPNSTASSRFYLDKQVRKAFPTARPFCPDVTLSISRLSRLFCSSPPSFLLTSAVVPPFPSFCSPTSCCCTQYTSFVSVAIPYCSD